MVTLPIIIGIIFKDPLLCETFSKETTHKPKPSSTTTKHTVYKSPHYGTSKLVNILGPVTSSTKTVSIFNIIHKNIQYMELSLTSSQLSFMFFYSTKYKIVCSLPACRNEYLPKRKKEQSPQNRKCPKAPDHCEPIGHTKS